MQNWRLHNESQDIEKGQNCQRTKEKHFDIEVILYL